MRKTTALARLFLGSLLIGGGTLAAAPAMDAALNQEARHATDRGIAYLKAHQSADGSWSDSVGVTSLALRGMLQNYHNYRETDKELISRSLHFISSKVQKDGSITEIPQLANYNTATAIQALKATGDPQYAEVIANAQRYLKGIQIDEGNGHSPDYKYYGGMGYGKKGDQADLSNEYIALEALKATDLNPNDPVWKKALVFIKRCQNSSETNDQEWAANDGGFIYRPGFSPYGGTESYGGMTYAGLASLLFAGLDKQDPAVEAAYKWMRANYTLDMNPGAHGPHGLYYYYNAFATAMFAYGDPVVVDSKGTSHNWRDDLAAKLVSLQRKDGSWVNEQSDKWWEGDPNLVTSWSVNALNLCIRE